MTARYSILIVMSQVSVQIDQLNETAAFGCLRGEPDRSKRLHLITRLLIQNI